MVQMSGNHVFPLEKDSSEWGHPTFCFVQGKLWGIWPWLCWDGKGREGCTLPAPEDTVALCAQALEGTSALLWLQEALENIPEHPAAVLGCGAWLGEQGASPHKALEAEFRSELLMAVVSWWRLVARLGCWGLSSGSQEGEGREKRSG